MLHVRVKVKNKCVRHQIVCESASFRVRETERESFRRPLNWWVIKPQCWSRCCWWRQPPRGVELIQGVDTGYHQLPSSNALFWLSTTKHGQCPNSFGTLLWDGLFLFHHLVMHSWANLIYFWPELRMRYQKRISAVGQQHLLFPIFCTERISAFSQVFLLLIRHL